MFAAQTTKKIDAIEFGLLSPDDVRKMSVAQIVVADTYDEDGYPIESGIMDPRLGVIDPGQRCRTCGNRVGNCPGHFGHIELARPVMHAGYAKVIHKVLRAVCRECSRILLTDEEIEYYTGLFKKYPGIGQKTANLSKEILKRCAKVKICPHCSEEQLKLKLEKPTSIYEVGEAGSVRLTPIDVRARLENVTDDDYRLLGINPEAARLEWAILTVLAVPPVTVRPSITLESGVRSEDDLSHKLIDIIRINQRLRENLDAGAPQLIVEDLWSLLEYHTTTYHDNGVSGIPPARHRSGRALRTLAQRLKGKEGRFRSNLSGKRVDFSARTVISPDPNLSMNEVGVPEQIAKILSIPQRVTEWNIEEMKELVIRGPDRHPGSNYLIRTDGRRVDLRFVKDRSIIADTIEPGFIVERHLDSGDIVLFNRQPSLHRMSIMAHEVRVMPYRTFRLSLFVCPPYNADFDGDEMNLHVPQSEEARAEARVLMRVQEQILSPRFGGPIIGALQDYISAAFLLTRKSTLFTETRVNQLLATAGYAGELPKPAILSPVKLWTGKQIFSMFIPEGLSLSFKANICRKCKTCKIEDCENDAYVVIRDGELLFGVVDEKAFGAGEADSLFHRIIKEKGPTIARQFMDSVGRLLVRLITDRGFTMGLDDVTLPREAQQRIRVILVEAEQKVEQLIETYKRAELDANPGQTLLETLEQRIQATLAEARDSAGEVAGEHLGLENAAVIMAQTGARGSRLNLSQMAAVVGQQSVRGGRISRGYMGRTLPHFERGDLGARARGFVTSSYKSGLDPIEYWFHAAGGREGLVDTAVRTSTSGYMQRRLMTALQDLKVESDGTVRTAPGRIVQFRFGDDGVDPSKSDHGRSVNIDIAIEKILGKSRAK
ncbi:MAG: DNA-directed RNA polymerase subunit A' [Candidatus Thorarchaeota archaeon]|nr:MAG: DNA-directed RNA polymerase subunit A' [Candidatus Thorarchaeota archaeon]